MSDRDATPCEGLAAQWCPNCGTCNCPDGDDGERTFDGNDCPLHGVASKHAAPDEEPDPRDATIARLTAELEEVRGRQAASESSHTDAATEAFDAIAKACGCPEWDYPGQLVRDVEALAERLRVREDDYQTLLDAHAEMVRERNEADERAAAATERAGRAEAALAAGAALIAAERQRQIDAEGYTPEHDDEHDRGEIADAAACYAARKRELWPWVNQPKMAERPTRDERMRELVKAGALIAAEIDRLLRSEARP